MGFRVVAPDMMGYGGTVSKDASSCHRLRHDGVPRLKERAHGITSSTGIPTLHKIRCPVICELRYRRMLQRFRQTRSAYTDSKRLQMISLHWRRSLVPQRSSWVDMTGQKSLAQLFGRLYANLAAHQGRCSRLASSTVLSRSGVSRLLRLHSVHRSTSKVLLYRRSRQRSRATIWIPTAPRIRRSRKDRER
jgi:hypothetical protein